MFSSNGALKIVVGRRIKQKIVLEDIFGTFLGAIKTFFRVLGSFSLVPPPPSLRTDSIKDPFEYWMGYLGRGGKVGREPSAGEGEGGEKGDQRNKTEEVWRSLVASNSIGFQLEINSLILMQIESEISAPLSCRDFGRKWTFRGSQTFDHTVVNYPIIHWHILSFWSACLTCKLLFKHCNSVIILKVF